VIARFNRPQILSAAAMKLLGDPGSFGLGVCPIDRPPAVSLRGFDAAVLEPLPQPNVKSTGVANKNDTARHRNTYRQDSI
jgi:hypothetical protein